MEVKKEPKVIYKQLQLQASETQLTEIIKAFEEESVSLPYNAQELLRYGSNCCSKEKGTALHRAAQYNKPRLITLLLQAGAYIEALDDSNRTPLHIAAHWSSYEAAQALVDNSADVGKNILFTAVISQHPGIVRLLLQHGAFVEAVDSYGQTSLHLALESGYIGAVPALLEGGADVNASVLGNVKKITPLKLALENKIRNPAKYQEIINELLARGAHE
jgi:ankyrin repeat protein